MVYAPHVDREHLEWLMKKIEKRCVKPDDANLIRVKGQRDLELAIVVAPEDRQAITPSFLVKVTKKIKKRTGIFMPIIYLDGNAPPPLDPYL